MIDHIINWITVEPTVSLLMIMTAIVLFASAVTKSRESSPTLWHWTRRIVESSIGAILFIALLWAFRSILNNNNTTFYSTHGSLSNASLASAQSIWGRPHVQREIGYAHYTDVVVQEEVPRENPNDPPTYRDVIVHQPVPQNSVTRFRGTVNLTLSEREKGYALYNGYIIDARFEYDMVNDSEFTTQAAIDFPLSPSQTMYENFSITVDGEDISSLLRFSPDLVQWTMDFTPHQLHNIVVMYTSRGMDTFYYQIPSQREIRDFELTLTIDHLPTTLLNYPDGILSPTSVNGSSDGQGSVLTWHFDHAITTAGMGVALPQPQQPGVEVLRVLSNSPYAVTLLGAMLALTLLLRRQPVQFLTLALLSAAYCVEFLVMASVSDFIFGFWGSLLVGAALTGTLTYLLFRQHPSRLLRRAIYLVVGFFTLVYPLSGLVIEPNVRNSFEGLVQVGLILYLFGLALVLQMEHARELANGTE